MEIDRVWRLDGWLAAQLNKNRRLCRTEMSNPRLDDASAEQSGGH